MSRFLHDPTMGIVEFCFGVAFGGFVGLWLIVALSLRRRKTGLDGTGVSQAEINSTYDLDDDINDDSEELEAEIGLPIPADLQVRKRVTPLMTCIAIACLVSVAVGSWLGYTNYNILQCWTNGEELLARGDFTGAEQLYRKAVRLDPRIRKSHLMLAKALMNGSNPILAVLELKLASQGEMSDPTAPILLGDELKSLSRLPEAVQAYRQAIAIAPRNTILYVRLGMSLALLKRNGDAIKELRFAVALDSNSAMAKSTLGQILVANRQAEEGIVLLKQAVDQAPDDLTTHNNLGCGYAHEKRYTQAVAEFRAAAAIDPYFSVTYFNLGCALRDTGDVRGAAEAFETCIRVSIKRRLQGGAAFASEVELEKLKNAGLHKNPR